ncbi:MAG: cupin domain-containing protein [Pseudonocardiaceae bacterium]
MQVTIPPHVDGPPQHIHHEHEETFYVVSRTPTFTCGTDTITGELGTLVTAPIGAPHTFGNPGDVPAIMLCTVTPDLIHRLLPRARRTIRGADRAGPPRRRGRHGPLRHGGFQAGTLSTAPTRHGGEHDDCGDGSHGCQCG